MKYLKKAYNIIYRDMYYSVACATMAGVANVLGRSATKSLEHLFGEGYVNNIKLGLVLNILYPIVLSKIMNSKHPWLYANMYCILTTTAFTLWHLYSGTENTALVMACTGSAVVYTTNKFVYEDQKLEDRLKDMA